MYIRLRCTKVSSSTALSPYKMQVSGRTLARFKHLKTSSFCERKLPRPTFPQRRQFTLSMANREDHSDVWQDADAARKYESAEKATRAFAKIIVEKSGLAKSSSDSYIFDLATGSGAAVKELYDAVPKEKWGQLKVLGGDISPIMLGYLTKRGEKEGWTGLETQVLDGNVSLASSTSRYGTLTLRVNRTWIFLPTHIPTYSSRSLSSSCLMCCLSSTSF